MAASPDIRGPTNLARRVTIRPSRAPTTLPRVSITSGSWGGSSGSNGSTAGNTNGGSTHSASDGSGSSSSDSNSGSGRKLLQFPTGPEVSSAGGAGNSGNGSGGSSERSSHGGGTRLRKLLQASNSTVSINSTVSNNNTPTSPGTLDGTTDTVLVNMRLQLIPIPPSTYSVAQLYLDIAVPLLSRSQQLGLPTVAIVDNFTIFNRYAGAAQAVVSKGFLPRSSRLHVPSTSVMADSGSQLRGGAIAGIVLGALAAAALLAWILFTWVR